MRLPILLRLTPALASLIAAPLFALMLASCAGHAPPPTTPTPSGAAVTPANAGDVQRVAPPPPVSPAPAPSAAPTVAASQPTPDPANVAVTIRLIDEPARRVVKLANGLTVILQQNKTASVVAVRIYVRAGSLTEQEFMGAGISHVLEHLVAGAGSKKVQEAKSNQMLQVLGGDSNANTSFDRTCYFITTTADKWVTALDLMSDWVTGADFTQEHFNREYQVVQRELEMGEAEAQRTFAILAYANRYLVHPARNPVIGYKTAFQKLTCQNCRDYYDRMYVPDNMIVSIAGDIDLDDALQHVQNDFLSVQRKAVRSIALPQEPAVASPRVSVGHADVKQARVEWAFPTVDMYSPDMYALDVLANILGSGESSILVRRLRDDKQLVTGISANDDTPYFAPGTLEIDAELPPEKILPAQQELLDTLQTILAKGVDAADVEKAKTQVAAALVYGNQSAEQQAERNGDDFLATGGIDFSHLYVDRIKQVTPEQVLAAARKYIHTDVLLTTILLPRGTPDSIVGLNAAANAVAEAQAVQKIVLPNGLRVLIRRNPSSPIVTMQAYTLGALLAEDDSNNGIGSAMMQLMQRGTKTQSADNITSFFDSTGGTLEASMGNNAFIVKATALRENADKTFKVFSDLALNPAFTTEELETIRPQILAAIDHETEDWFGEGYKFLRQTYYKDSPYSRLGSGNADVIRKLTAEQIRAHYQKYFLDPERTVLAIYGDVDPAQAAQWAQAFADIPKNTPPLASVSVAAPPHTANQITKKGSAAIFVGYPPGMTVTSDDRYAMTVLQTILAGYNAPFGSILFETLRGKGWVYVVEASNIAGPVPGMFMVMALGEPKNSDQIVKIIEQIMTDAKTGAFTDEQIRTAKDQAITGMELSSPTLADEAGNEALDELLGLGYDARFHFAENIRKVTREDLLRVAAKYLNDPTVAISSPQK